MAQTSLKWHRNTDDKADCSKIQSAWHKAIWCTSR